MYTGNLNYQSKVKIENLIIINTLLERSLQNNIYQYSICVRFLLLRKDL